MYTGWKTLLASVKKRDGINRDFDTKAAKAKRKKENDKKRAKTVRKYQKGGSGARVKIELDDEAYGEESDDDDAPINEESLAVRTQRLFVDFVRAHDVVITTYR